MNPHERQRGLPAFAITGALIASMVASADPASAAIDVDRPPTRTVSGGFSTPFGIAADAAGNVYVASRDDSIVVQAKNASGSSSPLRVIAGASTLLDEPRDVALDAQGFLYVVTRDGNVLVFAPEVDGDVAPIKSFGTGTGRAYAIDVTDTEIYVGKSAGYHVYARSATGSPAPTVREVTGVSSGFAIDVSGGKVWVSSDRQLRAYSTSADGEAIPVQAISNAFRDPSVFGIDTDSAGRVHVTHNITGTIRVFAANANGADQPVKILSGPASGLDGPTGLAMLDGNTFAVANLGSNSYSVFSTLFPEQVHHPATTTRPHKVRNLRMTGKAWAKKRIVRWKAPASDGGATITRYRIVIKKGNKTLRVRTVGKNRRSLVVKRSQLRKGVNKVYVQAKNSKGYGPKKMKKFRVRR